MGERLLLCMMMMMMMVVVVVVVVWKGSTHSCIQTRRDRCFRRLRQFKLCLQLLDLLFQSLNFSSMRAQLHTQSHD